MYTQEGYGSVVSMTGVELAIKGMTCASCAAHVEKQLNKLAGVTASVNLATETATVSFPATIAPRDLIAAVSRAGYTATLPPDPATPNPATAGLSAAAPAAAGSAAAGSAAAGLSVP